MKSRLVLFAFVASLTLAATGCGDDGEPPAATSAATAGGTATETESEGELGLPPMATAPPVTPVDGTPGGVGLTWYGQSMFQLRSPRGADILMDPYGPGIGYEVPGPGVGITTISHEHPDHNNAGVGTPNIVLRGLTQEGWAEIDERPTQDVRIRSVPSWHDDSQGSERGRNAIFVFETGGMRIVHLGDLGHRLAQAQIDAIGPVDVLLVPVGGFFTIDAAGATEVMQQLAPRLTIPMHYRTDAVTIEQLAPVDGFLEGKDVVQRGLSVELDLDDLPQPGSGVVWVLERAGVPP